MVMSVSQLNNDVYLLRSIANYIGTGYIRTYPNFPVTSLRVTDIKSIQHLILPFFHKYPLLGHKRVQFDLWLKAVLIIICTPKHKKELINALIELSNLQSRSKDKKILEKFINTI